jgi:hypothetical protein
MERRSGLKRALRDYQRLVIVASATTENFDVKRATKTFAKCVANCDDDDDDDVEDCCRELPPELHRKCRALARAARASCREAPIPLQESQLLRTAQRFAAKAALLAASVILAFLLWHNGSGKATAAALDALGFVGRRKDRYLDLLQTKLSSASSLTGLTASIQPVLASSGVVFVGRLLLLRTVASLVLPSFLLALLDAALLGTSVGTAMM